MFPSAQARQTISSIPPLATTAAAPCASFTMDEERDLSVTSGHGQIVGGYLLVVRDEVLHRARVERALGGWERSRPLVTGVGVTAGGRNLFVASPRIVLSAASSTRARVLAWFDMNGMRTGTMGEAGDLWQVRLSPDDRLAAVTRVAPLLRTLDISIVPAAPGTPRRPLTLALAADSDPVWAPDGRRVAFRSLQTGRPACFTKRVHDSRRRRRGMLSKAMPPRRLARLEPPGSTRRTLLQAPTSSRSTRRATRETIVKSGFNETDGRWSPDGAWLAYASDESGRPDIYATAARAVESESRSAAALARDGAATAARCFPAGLCDHARAAHGRRARRFAPAIAVLDAPGIRDFDVAHRRDALLALVPVEGSSSVPVSAMVDWQSLLPVRRDSEAEARGSTPASGPVERGLQPARRRRQLESREASAGAEITKTSRRPCRDDRR